MAEPYPDSVRRPFFRRRAAAGAASRGKPSEGPARVEALEALTGERAMDATAILDYFAPLSAWLDQQNAGQTCGW